jgi:hypothetical protein
MPTAPPQRECSWCAAPFVIVCRPGRPRLYCNHACRQRAYEHRHGFTHRRTVRHLPGQGPDDLAFGTGYERGGHTFDGGRYHAMRTSVRPEGRRRETLCGLLMAPTPGRWFSATDHVSCATCRLSAANAPLRHGVNASQQLARLRALLEEAGERRLSPRSALDWVTRSAPDRGT